MNVYLQATCHPLGFCANLTTNSRDVLLAAEESWGGGEREFDGKPLELRVEVTEGGERPPDPTFHIERNLFSIVSDRDNYAVADLDRLFASCYVTSRTLEDRAWFRWFFLDALILSLLAQQHVVPVHAGCVSRDGAGVLLFGSSGAGKSTLAWACARAGWSLLSDDATWLLPNSARPAALGRPQRVRLRPDATQHFPELAGLAPRTRPNGKLCVEIDTRDFPDIHTATHACLDRVVFLGRGDDPPGLVVVPKDAAFDGMMRDCAPFRDEVHARNVATLRKLSDLPAFRLHYRTLEEGVGLLSSSCSTE